jgi:hypothetical protein
MLCLFKTKLNLVHIFKFKVCKSMHHHTFQINQQLDATICQVYYLTFTYSSTCFGRPHAHQQGLNNCLWFYHWSVVVAVLLVVVGLWPNHDQQHCYHHTPMVKPEAATAVVEPLMMGVRTPETC